MLSYQVTFKVVSHSVFTREEKVEEFAYDLKDTALLLMSESVVAYSFSSGVWGRGKI